VDVRTIKLIKKTDEEKYAANLPSVLDVAHVIAQELHHTDSFMPPDRPMKEERREEWRKYRQGLRDLSKLPNATAMIKAWPAWPDKTDADKTDPIAHLRAKV
jgi:hypothetical protein